jgi:copper chaperone CopZ
MRLELMIAGMLAVHAKHAVFAALAGVDGVTRAEVELGRVDLDVSRGDAEFETMAAELRAAIEAVGYAVTEVRRLPRQLPTL